jgi:hypothetical protein
MAFGNMHRTVRAEFSASPAIAAGSGARVSLAHEFAERHTRLKRPRATTRS